MDAAVYARRMLASLLTLSLLASDPQAPVDPAVIRHAKAKLKFSLGAGDFIGSVWAAPSYREMVERAEVVAVQDLSTHASPLDSQYMLQGMPVVGPWVLLAHGGPQAQQDMWMLVTAGVLQAIGVTALTVQIVNDRRSPQESKGPQGMELSLSPVVANRLGICLTLTGF